MILLGSIFTSTKPGLSSVTWLSVRLEEGISVSILGRILLPLLKWLHIGVGSGPIASWPPLSTKGPEEVLELLPAPPGVRSSSSSDQYVKILNKALTPCVTTLLTLE